MARERLELKELAPEDESDGAIGPAHIPSATATDDVPAIVPAVGPPTRKRSLPRALLVAGRPKQWVKNVLVFAAPGAAGVLGQRQELAYTIVAFVSFCLAAAGTYYLNDASDVDADRLHPKKRYRPIAAGEVPVPLARALGPLFIAAAIALSFLTHWELAVVLVGYVALTTTYTIWWKHIEVVDIVAVAAGFVLRAIAGGAATHVQISNWFFIVTSFAALFMVVGKRYSESLTMGEGAASVRSTLSAYSPNYLAYLRSVSTAVMLVAYCLWAFDKADKAIALHNYRGPWFQLSIVPFAMAVLRYALLVDTGEGGAPEDLVFKDRPLLVFGLLWAVVFGIGVLLTSGSH